MILLHKEKKISFSLTSDGLENISEFLGKVKITIEHGLSIQEALKALTYNPANFLNVYEKVKIAHQLEKLNVEFQGIFR